MHNTFVKCLAVSSVVSGDQSRGPGGDRDGFRGSVLCFASKGRAAQPEWLAPQCGPEALLASAALSKGFA